MKAYDMTSTRIYGRVSSCGTKRIFCRHERRNDRPRLCPSILHGTSFLPCEKSDVAVERTAWVGAGVAVDDVAYYLRGAGISTVSPQPILSSFLRTPHSWEEVERRS